MRSVLIVGCLAAFMSASAAASDFRLYSPAVDGGHIDPSYEYDGAGCNGHNQSPELRWINPPPGTRSYAVSVHDPDAQTGAGFWHWRVVNIPASVTRLARNAGEAGGENLPGVAMQLRNDFGERGWAGMCPPPEDPPQGYRFTVHALGVERIDVNEDDTAAMVGIAIDEHQIEEASFVVNYGRSED